jgi:predicted DNA-binding transcriptional regulator AlpA
MPAATNKTYDASEVAALLGVSPWLIYQQVRAGSCPLPHIKLGRRLLFPWLEEQPARSSSAKKAS